MDTPERVRAEVDRVLDEAATLEGDEQLRELEGLRRSLAAALDRIGPT